MQDEEERTELITPDRIAVQSVTVAYRDTTVPNGNLEYLHLNPAMDGTAAVAGNSASTVIIVSDNSTVVAATSSYAYGTGALEVFGALSIASAIRSEHDAINTTPKSVVRVLK